jgi:hypothetical protein
VSPKSQASDSNPFTPSAKAATALVQVVESMRTDQASKDADREVRREKLEVRRLEVDLARDRLAFEQKKADRQFELLLKQMQKK